MTDLKKYASIKRDPIMTDEEFLGRFFARLMRKTGKDFNFRIRRKPLDEYILYEITDIYYKRPDGQYVLRGEFVHQKEAMEFVKERCYKIQAMQLDAKENCIPTLAGPAEESE